MKKRLLSIVITLVLTATAAVGLSSCGSSDKDSASGDKQVVKLGIMGASDEEIWDPIVEEFAKKGVDIEYVTFSDYTQPNAALDSGDIDLNAFQHHKYLESEIEKNGYDITAIGDTLLTSLNLYSSKVKSVDEIKKGDKIAVPSDAVNLGRALNVLQAAGLIKLRSSAGADAEVKDIASNPLDIELVQTDASQTASMLPDVAAAVINGAFALDADLSPKDDAIFTDDPSYYKDDSYINVIAARTEDKDNELYKEIVEAYQSDSTKKIFEENFQGLYIPAWK